MSNQRFRRAGGGLIDRARPLKFVFDDIEYVGFQGDTLASALLANGVRLVGRSFKYHRPRGIYSAGSEEPNALVTLGTGGRSEPNVRATMVELFDGLVATSQNRWPSLRNDLMSVNSVFSSFLPAGFYYKTFIWPGQKGWMFYEKYIRRAAGMGEASGLSDPDRYERSNAFCDVLVIGAGPAGLAAARAAGKSGARVILVDENPLVGGALLAEGASDDTEPPAAFAMELLEELTGLPNVTVMTRTTAYGLYDDNVVGLLERVEDHRLKPAEFMPRERSWTVRARKIVFATGAIERPMVFGNNDRPGVMLASAARRYANQYGVLPGARAVFFTNNDSAYDAAIDLAEAGMHVAAIIDAREDISESLIATTDSFAIPVVRGHVVTYVRGRQAVSGVELLPHDGTGQPVKARSKWIDCDLLCVSGGWAPSVHLHSHMGRKPVYSDEQATFVAPPDTDDHFSAGMICGTASTRDCLNAGLDAGLAAVGACGIPPAELAEYVGEEEPATTILPIWEIPSKRRAKRFVDFQDDVASSDVRLANLEGYSSVEHLKRYTTLGMGTDQGKTSNVNGLAILAADRGLQIPQVGTTVFRPPFSPVSLGAVAGQEVGKHFRPARLTPMDDWHRRNGAAMVEAGLWYRPRYYPRGAETMNDAYIREATHVREKVGMVDISTLGKIDVQGPDAAEFLNRIYANGFKKLPVGRARYGIMLREDGFVFDDGSTCRISPTQFFMTTTTANAAGVMSHLEYHLQVVWPDLRVDVTSITEQWAGMAIAGPLSRDVLAAAVEDTRVTKEALPFMCMAEGHIDRAPVRIIRLSFSGELAFEVYTPSSYGEAVWSRLMEVGKPFEIIPYGTEAMAALRIEKGHVAGAELDGRTTVGDLGLERMASTKKPYVGSVLRHREALVAEDRMTLVGLKVVTPGDRLRNGAHIVEQDPGSMDGYNLGHVTSVTYSPVVGCYIGLALMKGGLSRAGDVVNVVYPLKDESVAAEITDPVFYDPKGERVHA